LTYNYGIKKYELGNDFLGFSINSKKGIVSKCLQGKKKENNLTTKKINLNSFRKCKKYET